MRGTTRNEYEGRTGWSRIAAAVGIALLGAAGMPAVTSAQSTIYEGSLTAGGKSRNGDVITGFSTPENFGSLTPTELKVQGQRHQTFEFTVIENNQTSDTLEVHVNRNIAYADWKALTIEIDGKEFELVDGEPFQQAEDGWAWPTTGTGLALTNGSTFNVKVFDDRGPTKPTVTASPLVKGAKLEFSGAEPANPAGAIFDFNWRSKPAGSTSWGPWTGTFGTRISSQAVVTGLDNNADYCFQAYADGYYGDGPVSDEVCLTTGAEWRVDVNPGWIKRGADADPVKITATITNTALSDQGLVGTFDTDQTLIPGWKGEREGNENIFPFTLRAGETHTSQDARIGFGANPTPNHYDLPEPGALKLRFGHEIVAETPLTVYDDLDPPEVNLSTSDKRVDEGNGFSIKIKATPHGWGKDATEVKLSVNDPNGLLNNSADRTVTFGSEETSKTEWFRMVNDDEDYHEHKVSFNIQRPAAERDSYTIGDNQAVEVTLNDRERNGERNPRIGIRDVTGNEGQTVTFDVYLEPQSDETVTVDYATADGSATAGQDYDAKSGTLTFSPGEHKQSIDVRLRNDSANDDHETFVMGLSNISPVGEAKFSSSSATGTIRDNTGPRFSVSDAEGEEGTDDDLLFTVSADRRGSNEISVRYVTSAQTATENKDYHVTSGTLRFAAGESSKTVAVRIVDDDEGEDTETLTMDLYDPVNADIRDGKGVGRILDLRFDVQDAEANEDDGTIDFVITLTRPSGSSTPASVSYRTTTESGDDATPGTDYTEVNSSVTFGASETDKTVSVTLIDDNAEDDGETFHLELYRPKGGDIGRKLAKGTIRNDEGDDPEPATDALTASFSGMPDSHDGSSEFTFSLSFSEEPEDDFSYTTLRDHAFDVTNGDIRKAQRQTSGSNQDWTITVEPDGDDDVTITLPATTSCSASGAICTEDERKLSNSNSDTVEGPEDEQGTSVVVPSVSIADADAEEGDSLSFTVTLSEATTVAVSVDYGTSSGTATQGTDFAEASGTLTFSAGTTSKTVTVSTTEDTTREDDETFTVTLTNPSNATLGDATATGTIEDDDEGPPLTASFSGMPAEHGGAGTEFSFSLSFSEEPDDDFSYVTLRDHAFSVSNGDVSKARRQQSGSNRTWTIHVEPEGSAAVTVTLPPTTGSCSSSSAICTEDGRKLSNRESDTVAGPVGISVADATVEEGEGAVLAFVVSLSRAASSTLTVDYATSDGSALANEDYEPASGTLSIRTGQSSGTIEVTVSDDSHNEGNETLTLTLSNPSSGTLTDATATGTIENYDPMPQAFLSRFGRAIAVDVVDRVERRMEAPRRRGVEARFGALHFTSNRPTAADAQSERLGRRAPGNPNALGRGMPRPRTAGPAGFGPQSHHSSPAGLGPQTGVTPHMDMGPQTGMGLQTGMSPQAGFGPQMHGHQSEIARLLEGSSMSMGGDAAGGTFAFWSDTSRSSFSGREDALSLGGDVRTTMFGADYQRGRVITGLSVARSTGEGNYSGAAGGHLQAGLTGVYPWIGYRASERITIWGVAGRGTGSLLLAPEGAGMLRSDLSMSMGAVGTRGELAAVGGFALAVKTDALWVTTGVAGTDGPKGKLKATSGGVRRLRSALEGARQYQVAGRLALSPSVELGLRHDAGDAENGAGMDVGAGLVVADAGSGLSVDLRIRTLVVHQAEEFSERGVALAISYDPTPTTPLGFNARVTPSWGGQATAGAEALWSRETMGGMAHGGYSQGNRLDGELGYGLPVGTRFVGTPRIGLSTSEYGRDYRVGYGLGLLEQGNLSFELGIDAQRRESPMLGGASNGMLGQASLSW